MIISCIGHATFLLETTGGFRIVTDPVDAGSGYSYDPIKADLVLVSHKHHDHCALENVTGYTSVIDQPGTWTPAENIRVTAIPCWHDDKQGTQRGSNLIMVIETEGLRVVHLGDLGHLPTEEQLAAIGQADILMIPVGGFFTIDAQQAVKVADLLKARMVMPMHYRTEHNAGWPIAPLQDFLAMNQGKKISTMDLVRVTKGDLLCQPEVCVLSPQAKG